MFYLLGQYPEEILEYLITTGDLDFALNRTVITAKIRDKFISDKALKGGLTELLLGSEASKVKGGNWDPLMRSYCKISPDSYT